MLTRKLHINHCENPEYIREKQVRYSYAFRRMYKMLDSSADPEFIERFKETFSLTDIEYRSLVSEVKSFKDRENTMYEDKKERIGELQEKIDSGKLDKRKKYKALMKIIRLSQGIGRESTFGGRDLQQRLTRECNKQGDRRDEDKIKELRDEFRENRIIPFVVTGEASQKGNRFFDISRLTVDGTVVYKPNKDTHISLSVKVPRKFRKELSKLSGLVAAKAIPLTVRLSNEYLYLTFDEEQLHGYGLNENERRREVKAVKAEHHNKEDEEALIKDIYRSYRDEQRERKLEGKIDGRVMAVDLNPEHIGYSVLEKDGESGYSVIDCGLVWFKQFMQKTGKSSDSEESKHRNNKHRYEVPMVVKHLFTLLAHYRCSGFVVEDLSFKTDDASVREANRKQRNLWYRTLLMRCVTRRCSETGVELIKVNACYSSFIGNIQHPYADATNASVEIGRRGLYKYTKGGFYPHITEADMRTLEARFGDVVVCSTVRNWVEAYKSLTQRLDGVVFAQRLRTGITEAETPSESFSMMSYKSRVKLIQYAHL